MKNPEKLFRNRITISLTDRQYNDLHTLVEKSGLTYSQIVRFALENYYTDMELDQQETVRKDLYQ